MKEKLKTMNRDDFKFEICANSVESCLAAQEGGANRVELCAGIPEGGTTPSYGEIKVARKLLNETKLHVIIRPRGGDFLYTPLEIERMEEDIRLCRELGVDGVVIGCLTEDGEVDMEANRRLVELAKGDSELKPMSVTFHRAFDREPTLKRLWKISSPWVATASLHRVSSQRQWKAWHSWQN